MPNLTLWPFITKQKDSYKLLQKQNFLEKQSKCLHEEFGSTHGLEGTFVSWHQKLPVSNRTRSRPGAASGLPGRSLGPNLLTNSIKQRYQGLSG